MPSHAGQKAITPKPEPLQHAGDVSGELTHTGQLRSDEPLVHARPTGSIEAFIGRHAGKLKKPLTIQDMNRIAAEGWAEKR